MPRKVTHTESLPVGTRHDYASGSSIKGRGSIMDNRSRNEQSALVADSDRYRDGERETYRLRDVVREFGLDDGSASAAGLVERRGVIRRRDTRSFKVDELVAYLGLEEGDNESGARVDEGSETTVYKVADLIREYTPQDVDDSEIRSGHSSEESTPNDTEVDDTSSDDEESAASEASEEHNVQHDASPDPESSRGTRTAQSYPLKPCLRSSSTLLSSSSTPTGKTTSLPSKTVSFDASTSFAMGRCTSKRLVLAPNARGVADPGRLTSADMSREAYKRVRATGYYGTGTAIALAFRGVEKKSKARKERKKLGGGNGNDGLAAAAVAAARHSRSRRSEEKWPETPRYRYMSPPPPERDGGDDDGMCDDDEGERVSKRRGEEETSGDDGEQSEHDVDQAREQVVRGDTRGYEEDTNQARGSDGAPTERSAYCQASARDDNFASSVADGSHHDGLCIDSSPQGSGASIDAVATDTLKLVAAPSGLCRSKDRLRYEGLASSSTSERKRETPGASSRRSHDSRTRDPSPRARSHASSASRTSEAGSHRSKPISDKGDRERSKSKHRDGGHSRKGGDGLLSVLLGLGGQVQRTRDGTVGYVRKRSG